MKTRTAAALAVLLALGLLAIVLVLGPATVTAPSPAAASVRPRVPLAPDVASYTIHATLDSEGKTVQGSQTARYRNPSSDTLREVYLHLYLNAFRSADTLWMRESGGAFRSAPFDQDAAGWIRVDSVEIAGQSTALEPDETETIARLPLPAPLAPGGEVALDIKWTAQLPRVFARTGWAPGGFTMVAQWYPKLAVYDSHHGGWDREPWHATAEFFHDFGSYDLTLTAPAARTVVANGNPDGSQDNGDGTRTWRFTSRSITDAVWVAGERLALRSRPTDVGLIEVALPEDIVAGADRYLDMAEYSLRRYGEWLGPYPWDRLQVVVPPPDAGGAGGMEYPMLVTSVYAPADLPAGIRESDLVTAHEVAHEWFPMQAASNEARDPFLDEAFADYLTQRVMADRFGAGSFADLPLLQFSYLEMLRLQASVAITRPVTLPAWQYTFEQYGAAVYGKGSIFLATLEGVFGSDPFTAAMRDYFEAWRWRHPKIADFQATLGEHLGAAAVDPWFDQLAHRSDVLEVQVSAVEAGRAVVERTGDAALPVDGVLLLDSGRRVPWALAAEEQRLELAPPPGERIAAAIADPERRLPIQMNRVDDGMSVDTLGEPLGGLWARWTELLAVLLQILGQFG